LEEVKVRSRLVYRVVGLVLALLLGIYFVFQRSYTWVSCRGSKEEATRLFTQAVGDSNEISGTMLLSLHLEQEARVRWGVRATTSYYDS